MSVSAAGAGPFSSRCGRSVTVLALSLAFVVGCGGTNTPLPCVPDGSTVCAPLVFGPIVHLEEPCGPASPAFLCPRGQSCWRDDDFPQGACSTPCDRTRSADCGFGTLCATVPGGDFCLKNCRNDFDCPANTFCGSLKSQAGQSVCLPTSPQGMGAAACAAPNVLFGGVVGPAAGPTGCIKPVTASAFGGPVEHLGVVPVGQTLSVNVPSGTASMTFISQAVDAGQFVFFRGSAIPNSVIPSPISGPEGIIFSDTDAGSNPPIFELSDIFFGGGAVSTGSLTVPNTTGMLERIAADHQLPAGTWKFAVSDYQFECTQGIGCDDAGSQTGFYDVTVLLKPGPPKGSGTLDLSIYLITSAISPPGAGGTLSDPNLNRVLKQIETLYGAAGICLGKVTFYQVPPWALARYGTVSADNAEDPCSDLHQMFTLAKSENALSLFFVDAVTTGADGGMPRFEVLGIDGTIPGPATVGGTVQSGAVVTASFVNQSQKCTATHFDPVMCGPDAVAYVAAHEGGHFLGLYHTTEASGEAFDPLLNTPVCQCELCAPTTEVNNCEGTNPRSAHPYFMHGEDCATRSAYCGGGDNLMFWLLNDKSAGTVSSEQAQVMAGSPAVQ